MQIVQATFGVFHSFELAQQLYQRGHLRRIYSTWPWQRLRREGIPRELVSTFPLIHTADYLLGRTRFYPQMLRNPVKDWISTSFDGYLRRAVPPCDALIALSGAGLRTASVVQSRGGKFICDRGSTHHRFQHELLQEEYRRWGAPPPEEAPGTIERDEQIYALADAITVPSTAAARSFTAMGVPTQKVHTIPYGVRLDQFQHTADPEGGSFEVLCAGQVSLRKGIPYVLQAFAALRHPGKHLTVAGAVQEHMVPLLQSLPTDHVTFLGPIPQKELMERMNRSHLLVLASVEEGLALVQAQAMACGCPVLATTATGAEDLFTDGVEGYIVPERDPAALTLRMEQVASDPVLRQRLSNASLARVRQLGGWQRYGDLWESLLQNLTGKP